MGSQKVFHAYDLGADTIVFERDVWDLMDEHASVLVAEKNDLAPGNHPAPLAILVGLCYNFAPEERGCFGNGNDKKRHARFRARSDGGGKRVYCR